MKYTLFGALFLAACPVAAFATDAPAGQTPIDAHHALRGHFVEERPTQGSATPMRTVGHFTLAPSNGLLWSIEQPFPTTTIVTPNGAAQDLGGIALKLPAKNLRHLYDMVGGALTGDWSRLEEDFILTPGGDAHHWQMTLTPRHDGKAKLNYATITVGGGRFVESIVMTKGDGSTDSFTFSDETLSALPLNPAESASFSEVKS